jgi:hypothetical protein
MTVPRVAVRTDSARVEHVERHVATILDDPGFVEARRRFGGWDGPASLAGALTAVGTAVLVAGVLSGLGRIGYQVGLEDDRRLSVPGLIGGLATLAVAFLVGGWVAGRVARYDGPRNGALTALWFAAMAAGVAVLASVAGTDFDLFANAHLPEWFSSDARSAGAILSGLAGVVVAAAAGWLGGHAGERWHRRADALIAHTRPGAMARLEVPR